MSEEPDNLTLLHLRSIRGDMAKIAEQLRGMKMEMFELRQRVAGFGLIQELQRDEMASVQVRLDRIERRLELTEHSEAV